MHVQIEWDFFVLKVLILYPICWLFGALPGLIFLPLSPLITSG